MSLMHFSYKSDRLVQDLSYSLTSTLSGKIRKVYSKIFHPRDFHVLRFKVLLFIMHRSNLLRYPAKRCLLFFKDVGTFESLGNYVIKHPEKARYLVKYPQSLSYTTPRFFPGKREEAMIRAQEGFRYVAEIKNARVIGGSGLILVQQKRVLYEIKDSDQYKKFQYTDEALHCCDDEYCLIKSSDSEMAFEEAITLAGNFSWNYYHLLYEVLVKFEQVNELDIDLHVPVLVDRVCFEVPQYFELLTLLNKRGRKLIALDKAKRYPVDTLYTISCPNIIPPHYMKFADASARDFLYDLHALDYLRNSLMSFASGARTPKRIFISRRKASQRRKFNEDEVYGVLEKLDFSLVYPEDYSIAGQIALFNNADIIAGGSGAAFSNLLFCRESCKVICFSNYPLPLSLFSTIAGFVDFEFLYLTDESKEIDHIGNIHDPFTINTDSLYEIVSAWICQDAGSIVNVHKPL
jgi:capsular polysaccharide biosynthesis protein